MKKSLSIGILLGITLVVSMGIVYIDNVVNYWQFNSGFVRLVVNTNAQAIITVDTNTMRFGIRTNNSTAGVVILGALPPAIQSSLGDNQNTPGAVLILAGDGGSANRTTTATGGQGGRVDAIAGTGGQAVQAVTNAVGGPGGTFNFFGGAGGGGELGAATNSTTGGSGGQLNIFGGSGGSPITPSASTTGGAGGAGVFGGGAGGSPGAGATRRGGNGGAFTMSGGSGGTGNGTNGGSGGKLTLFGGAAGAVSGTGGHAGAAGVLEILGGAGATAVGGGTNSNGGDAFIAGGAPGSGAIPGNVVLARTAAGVTRGAGVQVGPLLGGSATITNILGAAAALDFPSTATLSSSDLLITVTGATSNNIAVALSVPWQSASGGGAFTTYSSNDSVYVRFVNNTALGIDPNPGTFSVVCFRIR